MDIKEVCANSPMLLALPDVPMTVAFGESELPELVRQSEEYAAVLKKAGRLARRLSLPGEDHFSILEQLARADGAIALEVARLAAL